MNENQIPEPLNPNNAELPFGQPHYPKSNEHIQDTKKGSAPTNPPPSTMPQHKGGVLTVDPGALRGCLYRDTYIKLKNRSSFWYHPTYIDYLATTGYKWNGFSWIPWGTDLDQIVTFQCT